MQQTIIFEGPKTIAAIVIESVPGTAGVLVPPAGYLDGLRALCDKYEILWIADEVMSGFGRTGKWFGFQHSKSTPDLIVFAKGVTSGYVPLGGVIIPEKIAKTFDERVFPGGLTYSGHPLACATAVATIDVMKSEKMVENARDFVKKVLENRLGDIPGDIGQCLNDASVISVLEEMLKAALIVNSFEECRKSFSIIINK